MATLYEYYNTGDDDREPCYGSYWHGQTFTPATAHTITSVKLLLFRNGFPGIVTVSIRATDANGHPTGEDLCSGTTNGNTLPPGSPYEWREITFGAGYALSASIKYAIVGRAPNGDGNNYVLWRADGSSPTYADGNRETSDNGGSTWTSNTTYDFMFEDWGDPAGQTYDKTGKLQVILGIQSNADAAIRNEMGREQVILTIPTRTDVQTMVESRLQTVLAVQTEVNTQTMQELDKLQVLLSILSETDGWLWSETGLQVLLAILNETDGWSVDETQRLQVILGIVESADTQFRFRFEPLYLFQRAMEVELWSRTMEIELWSRTMEAELLSRTLEVELLPRTFKVDMGDKRAL